MAGVREEIPNSILFRGKRYTYYKSFETESSAIRIQNELKKEYPGMMVCIKPVDTSEGRRRAVYIHK
jgi:hypothetical protein